MNTNSDRLPTISVILPVYNEGRNLHAAVHSLLQQQTSTPGAEFNLEILVIDGLSTDGSVDTLRKETLHDPRVRFLTNEKRKTPFAFNMGLGESRGEFVAILGSHNQYLPDYLAVCLAELRSHDAVGCSGRVISHPPNPSLSAKLASAVSSHKFGSSGRSFRTQPQGFADTIPYPVFRRQALLDVGGYDESLHRNQDNDMNERLRRAGHRLYCTWLTSSLYHTQPTLTALCRYARRNGYWNIVSLRKNAASMSLRHFIPLLFVLSILIGVLVAGVGFALLPAEFKMFAWLPLAAVFGLYLLCASLASIDLAVKQRSFAPLLLPPAFLAFHISYGLGSIQAMLNGGREPMEG